MLALENAPDAFEMPVSVVAIGDKIAFAGVPGEPFTDIGRKVKAGSPYKTTMFSCLTNGSYGYFPVASAYREGGYEARSSVFDSSVADVLKDGLLNLLHDKANRSLAG